jgi:hypothetical protein
LHGEGLALRISHTHCRHGPFELAEISGDRIGVGDLGYTFQHAYCPPVDDARRTARIVSISPQLRADHFQEPSGTIKAIAARNYHVGTTFDLICDKNGA